MQKLFILNELTKHLETPNTHARLLFADFSSAFNLMQPHILLHKLTSTFNIVPQLVLWIADFLTHRSQQVLVNGCFSDVRFTSTGSPQGCCLSPLLYILYTDDCRSNHNNTHFVKFADDTAILSLLTGNQHVHGPALDVFVDWCDLSFLELNINKTQELIIDFRTREHACSKSVIHGKEVQIVSTYKYLGTVFDDKLTWDENTNAVIKKCNQRLYFLRKLNSFSVDKSILKLFYSSFIESVLTFSFVCWFFSLSVKNRSSLHKVVNLCSKVIGVRQRDLTTFCEHQILRKAHTIILDPYHVLHSQFELLPSGRRFRVPVCKTNRRKFTFLPTAINLLNRC